MACDHKPAARSSKYALRSYLYLLLHAAVAGPAALLFGTGAGAALHARHKTCSTRHMPCVLQATRRQSLTIIAAMQHKSCRQARNVSHVVKVHAAAEQTCKPCQCPFPTNTLLRIELYRRVT